MQQTTSSESYFDAISWLNQFEPEARKLQADEIRSVTQFSLLWNLFEAQVCNHSGSVHCFRRKADEWEKAGLLALAVWEPYLKYFQRRYIENEGTNEIFAGLHLRPKDNPDLVAAVLKGENTDIAGIITALLTIVYRYRSNLFHGLKWIYGLHGQADNFNTANQVLARALEINRRET